MIPNYPFFIEASTILFILYCWYHFTLSQEQNFVANRVILWTIVLATTIIPLVGIDYFPLEAKLQNINLGKARILDDEASWGWKSIFFNVMVVLYAFGVIFYLSKIVLFLIEIFNVISQGKEIKMDGFTLIQTNQISEPSSFLSYIFTPTPDISNAVLLHELAHVKAKHSLDVIFFSCFRAIFWFHPLSHFLLKAIRQNHEFYCDQQVLSYMAKDDYCLLLLNRKLGKIEPVFINHFSSFIKKRINMIQQPKSSYFNGIKITTTYLFVVLLASIFVLDSYPLLSNSYSEPQSRIPALTDRADGILDTLPKEPIKNAPKKSKVTKVDPEQIKQNQSFDEMSEEEVVKKYPGFYSVVDTIKEFNPDTNIESIKIVKAEFRIAYKMLIEREKRKPVPDQEKIDLWYQKL